MKIPLKEGYSYKNIANVYNSILYIHHLDLFHGLMFDITYTANRLRCYYCGAELTRETSTLDHIYPVFLGGPYIPCNLCVCCHKCNNEKDSMTIDEYYHYKTLPSNEKKVFKVNYKRRIRTEIFYKSPNIPDGWFSYEKIDKINITICPQKNQRLSKPRVFFKKYKRIRTPIIVDKNYNLLDGFYSYIVAKENNLEEVPVIVLENVILEQE